MLPGHRYGIHRVIEPKGVLPQPAWRLDASPTLYDNELLIEVDVLNIDSASFQQIKEECQGDLDGMKRKIFNIVQERGKMHNPVTGSGGMLIGTIKQIGRNYPHVDMQVGDRIATLVSLTLTPLYVEEILDISLTTGQVQVRGQAILLNQRHFAKLPTDLPEAHTLALLDVCGAPAQVNKLCHSGDTVLIIGAGGKSGLLSTYAAKQKVGSQGKVIALEFGDASCQTLRELQIADVVIQADATNAIQILELMEQATAGELADLVINCVNVPHSEMSTILATKDGGTAYFFSMATSFTAAALGAEGVGKDIQLMIGNGYTAGHAQFTIDLVRNSPVLKSYFYQKYSTLSK